MKLFKDVVKQLLFYLKLFRTPTNINVIILKFSEIQKIFCSTILSNRTRIRRRLQASYTNSSQNVSQSIIMTSICETKNVAYSFLCVFQTVLNKNFDVTRKHVNDMMNLKLLQSENGSTHEECLLLLSAVVESLKEEYYQRKRKFQALSALSR